MSIQIPKNNGAYKNTIIIRPKDDTFIDFNYELKICNDENIGECLKVFEDNISLNDELKKNTILDIRLEKCIIYALKYYDDDILIYNIYDSCIINIYQWFVKKFNVSENNVNIKLIKKICIAYIIIDFYLMGKIIWNNSNILKYVKKDTNIISFTFDFILNFIKIHKGESNNNNINYITNNLINIVNQKPDGIIKPLKLKELKITHADIMYGIISLTDMHFTYML